MQSINMIMIYFGEKNSKIRWSIVIITNAAEISRDKVNDVGHPFELNFCK